MGEEEPRYQENIMFMNGEWVDGLDRAMFDDYNPYTGAKKSWRAKGRYNRFHP